MRLNEIDNKSRQEKKIIDKLFIKYTVDHSSVIHDEIVERINQIYPTGYYGMDSSLEEYRAKLADDVIERLRR